MDKPITVAMNEFRQNFANLMNNSGLPAWLLLMLIEPFTAQLRQLAELQEKEAATSYAKSVEENNNECNNNS